MSPPLRRALVTAHVVFSAGWTGCIAAYVVVTVAAIAADTDQAVRVCYEIMTDVVWWVVLPFDLASLVTGLLLATLTSWGLLRHRWVVAKLVLSLVATAVLLVYVGEIGYLAGLTERTPIGAADLETLQSPEGLLHSVGGAVVVLTAVVLGVWKPRGLTRYGARRLSRSVPAPDPS
jgi:hypothetical protein